MRFIKVNYTHHIIHNIVNWFICTAVDKTANEEEIKKAYRKRAMVHHPDRHAGATEVEKKDHEQKFKEVKSSKQLFPSG